MDLPSMDHYHGSRNHAWLCGGLAEWLHSALGGIRPLGEGFAEVAIEPKVSTRYGPTSINASLQTVRGVIHSNWTRFEASSGPSLDGRDALFTLNIVLPVGVVARDIVLPLLTPIDDLSNVVVMEGRRELWQGGEPTDYGSMRSVQLEPDAGGGSASLRMRMGSGQFGLTVFRGRSRAA